jgi:hypothetical protein
MTDHLSPKENRLLAALPADAYERLFHNLEPVVLTLGNVIYESGDELRYAYFPTTCIISAVFTQPLDYAEHRIIEGLGKNSHIGRQLPGSQ